MGAVKRQIPVAAHMAMALDILRTRWGHQEFKTEQREALEAVFRRRDVLAVLPTGFGKSAIFQLPPLVTNSTVLVISPLISLMQDQVVGCEKRGIAATFVNSSLSMAEWSERMAQAAEGAYRVLYVSPERLRNERFCDLLEQVDVQYIAVDECHCASRWAKDFRPAYGFIHETVARLARTRKRRPVVIAVTATATRDAEDDIRQAVGLRAGYVKIVGDPIRPNHRYTVLPGSGWNYLRQLAPTFDPSARHIVYAISRAAAEKARDIVCEVMEERFGQANLAGFYHAGMKTEDRAAAQAAFIAGRLPVIVATNAFGMGIDVPNIRTVIHLGISASLEDYLQETGRAGRDGVLAHAILLFDEEGVRIRRLLLDTTHPPYAVYIALWHHLNEDGRSRGVITKSDYALAGEINDARAEALRMGVSSPYALHTGVVGPQISSAMDVLESVGAVYRRHVDHGMLVTLNHAAMNRLIATQSEGSIRRILSAMMAIAAERGVADGERAVIPRTDMLASSGELTWKRALSLIARERAGVVHEEILYGKTTEILRAGEAISTVLPLEQVMARRAADERKLQYMIGYARATDRVAYIREYFK
jgi:RecQ family ATP-dependent DNA helicase